MKNRILAGLALTVMSNVYAQQQQSPDVLTDIRSRTPLGSYADIAERYDVTAVPDLIDLIGSTEEMQHWVRAAGVLGVIGDDRAADALISLIERPAESEYVPREWHDARSVALRALGFLVNRTDNQQALEYLIASLDDTIWRRRGLRGVVSYINTYDRYDVQMSQYAIFALALSGHPRAGEALRSLRDSPTSNQQKLREGLDDILKTWLEVYNLVAERGVEGMYEHFEQQRQFNRTSVN